jgi:sulfatase maturation enzyme AslB (radical SAM superfamily)
MSKTEFKKWENLKITAKGEERGHVPFSGFKTLWFNTGTLCNLECKNCYIESSPKNDRLVYIDRDDVIPFLDEIKEENWDVNNIGLTGGEPFLNPHIIEILDEILKRGFSVLVLTNAFRVLKRWEKKLHLLKETYGELLRFRVSLDHYTQEVHEQERGPKSFDGALAGLKWLYDEAFQISIAGRSLTHESQDMAQAGYQKLINDNNINITLSSKNLVIFPEMDPKGDVPEITVDCWGILNVSPEAQMCAHERMVVKKKGQEKANVQACTLLAYDETFDMGTTLKESTKSVHLNHPFCAEFCVLGGASCSST